MRFKQKDGTKGVWDGEKVVPFTNGILETDDPVLIKVMQGRYEEVDDGREAEQGDTEGQEIKAEPTYAELREEAKAREVEGFYRMNKQELIEALKEGE